MRRNVCSKTDRTLRIIVGLFLLSMLFWLPAPYLHFGWIGLIPIATAMFGYCPISHLLGIDTCSMRHA